MTVDLRLAIPAAVAWLACAVVIALPALPIAIGLWAITGVLTAVTLTRRRLGVAALAAAAAALCCTSIVLQFTDRFPEGVVGRADSITATTTETVLPGARFFSVRLDAVGEVTMSTPALVFAPSPAARLGIGTPVTMAGELVATEPGDDVAFLVFSDDAPVAFGEPPWVLQWANALRAGFVQRSTALPGAGGDLLAGLAIGDTSAVDDELDAAMKTSSLSHLTAVSGANCAIVVGLIVLAGAAAGVPRWLRLAASVAVLVAFVVLVTPDPSVLRAAVMAVVVLGALGAGRPVRGLPVLALATLVLLVLDPWLARSYGFVLSVLATGGLLLLAAPLSRVFERWMPRWRALAVAVPLAAQLACQPVILLLSPTIPTYGVIANMLAAPAAPVATVVGLAACVVLPIAPPLAGVLCQLAWLPSAWIAAIASFFSAAPAARLPWPGGAFGVGLLLAVSTLGIVAIIGHRWWLRLLFGVAIVAYAGLAGGAQVAGQLSRPDWQIAMCDVGQGDAVFVRSAQFVALVDTGRDPGLMTTCLENLGIERIDLLVLTHYDADHVGGLSAVVGRVEEALVGPSGGEADDLLGDALRAGGARVDEAVRGQAGLFGDYRWSVLWPPVRTIGMEPGNDLSVAVQFEPIGQCASGCVSSVFLGDLGEMPQNRLLAANPALAHVDVVKVSHHGSADQSGALYARLQATVALIGVGVGNGYGHPTASLLGVLADVGSIAVRTDEHGLVLLAPGQSHGTVTVWAER